MNISEEMLRHYIAYVTEVWFGREDLPPDDIERYRPLVDNMILVARNKGDLQDFRVGLEALLANPSTDWESYAAVRYPYDADESKQVLEYIRSVLAEKMGHPSASEIREVQLTPEHLRDWWAARGR